MKFLKSIVSAVILSFSPCALAQDWDNTETEYEMTAEEQETAIQAFLDQLDRKTGTIILPQGNIVLTIPDGYYYLDEEDARAVLVDAWGNLPTITTNGMIFPAEYTPLDMESWGVNLEFEKIGYVSDKDATKINYTKLLKDMQAGTDDANSYRERMGHPTVELIGWAASPRYDAETHRLYWAKELSFSDSPSHTLNYDMRVLGRHGVLSMNFISDMSQLNEVEAAAADILAMPSFKEGSRYEDYDSTIDPSSSIGIAGLVAGGTAAAVIAKKGGLAFLLIFLKKGAVFILVALAAIGRFIMGIFGGGRKDQ